MLRLAADGLGGGVDGRPVEGIGDQPGGEELGIAAQHHPVGLHILGQDIDPAVEALPQTPALSDGIADGAVMSADDLAGSVDKLAGGVGFSGVFLQEFGIVAVGDEADILGILLLRGDEAAFPGDGTDLVLAGKLPQGEAGMGQLLLGQEIEDIGLILRLVLRLFQKPAVSLLAPFDPGIVAGDDGVAAEKLCPVIELGEFHVLVAVDAGVGGRAGLIGADETVDDLSSKILGEVEDMEFHAQTVADAPGVLRIRQGAAGLRAGIVFDGAVVEFHVDTNTLMSLPDHQGGGNTGIHSAGHGDEGLTHSRPWSSRCLPGWRSRSSPWRRTARP